jgi:plasmid stability protein
MKHIRYRSKAMPSLQIRNLPDDLYQTLTFRAEQAHRSLAQQALIELLRATGSANAGQRERILDAISQDIAGLGTRTPHVPPETLLREDRDR